MSSSMTLSLILNSQPRHRSCRFVRQDVLTASALYNEDVLVADRSLCSTVNHIVPGRAYAALEAILISTLVSPLLNFFKSTFAGF